MEEEKTVFLCGGNFFDVIPYEGRYDSQPLALFSVDKRGEISYLHQPSLFDINGQVRDLKWVKQANKKIVFAALNNDRPQVFQWRE